MDHPIWSVLEHQGRSLRWLARRTGYSEDLMTFVKTDRRRATAEFRQRCATALDIPEALLFTDAAPVEAAS